MGRRVKGSSYITVEVEANIEVWELLSEATDKELIEELNDRKLSIVAFNENLGNELSGDIRSIVGLLCKDLSLSQAIEIEEFLKQYF